MKKIFMIAAAISILSFQFSISNAQKPTDRERMEWNKRHAVRDASRHHLTSGIKLAPATKEPPSAKSRGGMPNDSFWFPGEWEEVQAVVVTPQYSYEAPAGVSAYYVDPMVGGIAAYYSSYDSQYPSGYGPYVAVMDTNNSSLYNYVPAGDVPFYLMDAIQMGGAQAWVRIEQADDSAVVVRKLQRMGLRHNNLRFFVAPGNSFWYRDCGPICFYYGAGDTVGMLDFEYYPGRALDDSLPVYIERQFGLPNFTTSIEWEGGNCLVDGAGMVVSSDAIYGNNMDSYGQLTWDGEDPSTINYTTKTPLSRAKVKDSLAALIGTRATYILPAYKYDGGTGHIDLYADMLDENMFVFSRMPDHYSNWTDYNTGSSNMTQLCTYQTLFDKPYVHRNIPFPSTDNGGYFSSQGSYNRSFTRTYSNHTFVNNVIIQPCFSAVGADGMPTAEWDRANIEELKNAYQGYTIYCVDVRGYDGSGGAIHCITKQIPAEHPIRILHPSITGNTGDTYNTADAPITATVTNVDGISGVTLTYRIGGGEWDTVAMTASGNEYSSTIPTTGHLQGDYTTVEYYLTATSNAGKVITKPMTAAQGGYFSFQLGNKAGIEQAATVEERFGQFYPNPASEQANMVVDLAEGTSYTVTILDLSGRTIHTTSLQAQGTILYTVNTSLLAAGQYTVVFSNDNEQVIRKLIVK